MNPPPREPVDPEDSDVWETPPPAPFPTGACLVKPDILAAMANGDVRVQSVLERFQVPQVGPNSVDLHLHPTLLRYRRLELDAHVDNETDARDIPEHGMVLRPGHLYLGRTEELVTIKRHVPLIGGRSSTGRLGINVHVTAGFGDVGFWGTWTLEIFVIQPVRVYPYMKIAQLWLFTPSSELADEDKYKGRYQGQLVATPCRDKEW